MTILRLLQNKIQGDFIVMEGDSIVDIPLDEVLDTHI